MLKDILAISGQSGLFKLVSKGKNSIIVESLLTGKRTPAHSTAKIISLNDIAIYTEEEEVQLREVLKAIAEKESFGPAIDHKSSANELKAYFVEVLPDYDKDRVYVSDIKKVIQWYNTLQSNELLNFDEVEEETNDAETAE